MFYFKLHTQEFATQDPEGFLKIYNEDVIFDEIQPVPALFSYLQEKVDEAQVPGQFILSGSQNTPLHSTTAYACQLLSRITKKEQKKQFFPGKKFVS